MPVRCYGHLNIYNAIRERSNKIIIVKKQLKYVFRHFTFDLQ
jgi:hypothetical protein